MKAELQISRVEDCFEWLETSAEDYTAKQSIGWLVDQLGALCKSMAFVNNQMAVSKEKLNRKKTAIYNRLATSSIANQEYYSPSLAKDWISARLLKEQYDYDICERCSRTLFHTIEALRTCIAALREEIKISSYAH